MPRLLLIYRVMLDDPINEGIRQKLRGQVQGFEAHGFEVDNISLGQDGLFLNGILSKKYSLNSKSKRYYYFLSSFYDDLEEVVHGTQPSCIYIRHFLKTPKTLGFLRSIKKANPTLKVILEIPTYPYLNEFSGLIQKAALAIDQKVSTRLGGLIDYIVHFGVEKSIWNIPAIGIQNGVLKKDLDFTPKTIGGKIVFVGLGKLWDWWGLDLFFQAISEYITLKSQPEIKVEIIGDGKEMKNLKSLMVNLNLQKVVTFHGILNETNYQRILMSSHLGIGTLALDRKKVKYSSALKHREYASYGLPFFLVGEDLDFTNINGVHALKDKKQLDVASLIDWFIKIDQKKVIRSLKIYSDNKLTWSIKLGPVCKVILT